MTGPAEPFTMKQFLEACASAYGKKSGKDLTFTWTTEAFLMENKVVPWIEMPLWLPKQEAGLIMSMNNNKALNGGLQIRPLQQTIMDTLDWELTRQNREERKAGMSAEREAELLRLH